jgi:uncharacterized protein with FMN-binding domain
MVTRDRRSSARNAGVTAATGLALVILFLYPTSTNHLGDRPGQPPATAIVAGAAAGTVPSGDTSAAITSAGGTRTVDGTAVATRFGPVQVQVQVRGDRVVAATAIDYPRNNGRDRQINAYAVPALNAEAVDAQSAEIDTVSGATFTSLAYRKSLQAALDSAHLG